MDVCVENVFTASAVEAINVIQATAEENDRAASFDPGHGHRETAAGQEAAAQSPSNDPPSASLPDRNTADGNGGGEKSVVRLGMVGNVQNFQPQNP